MCLPLGKCPIYQQQTYRLGKILCTNNTQIEIILLLLRPTLLLLVLVVLQGSFINYVSRNISISCLEIELTIYKISVLFISRSFSRFNFVFILNSEGLLLISFKVLTISRCAAFGFESKPFKNPF